MVAGLGLSFLGWLHVHVSQHSFQVKRLYIRDAVGERSRACGSRDCARADKHLNTHRTSVNLNAIKSRSSLGSLFVFVEDDGCASNTTASGIVLEENLLRPAYVDC